MQDFIGRRIHQKTVSSELSGLSIYQPGKKSGQGEFPCFLGFYACFVERAFDAGVEVAYM
jgi:hypothetical protein